MSPERRHYVSQCLFLVCSHSRAGLQSIYMTTNTLQWIIIVIHYYTVSGLVISLLKWNSLDQSVWLTTHFRLWKMVLFSVFSSCCSQILLQVLIILSSSTSSGKESGLGTTVECSVLVEIWIFFDTGGRIYINWSVFFFITRALLGLDLRVCEACSQSWFLSYLPPLFFYRNQFAC